MASAMLHGMLNLYFKKEKKEKKSKLKIGTVKSGDFGPESGFVNDAL